MNTAIGATGSDLGLFRVDGELINRDCDLVFVEYIVNDYATDSERRLRVWEGLIRKLKADSAREIVIVYTFSQPMYEDMAAQKVPSPIQEIEQLATHYDIGSVWAGLHAWNEVRAGLLKWDEWLPDGLHPMHRGSLSYGQSVIAYLEREFENAAARAELDENSDYDAESTFRAFPVPYSMNHYERTGFVPFDEVTTEGPWLIHHSASLPAWCGRMLCTAAIGAKLSFAFVGRGAVITHVHSKRSAEFLYRVDREEWQASNRTRSEFLWDDGRPHVYWLAENLMCGVHHVELEVTQGNGPRCTGTDFHLMHIGVIK